MTVLDNTRSHDNRRWEESYQQLQQAMEEFREQQNQVNEQIRELITGLSRQLLQIATNAAAGEVSSSNSNKPYSRLSRIEFPQFGGEDVMGWLYKCEQFFEVDNITHNVKVKVASIHLTGKALLWHQSYMKIREWEIGPRGKSTMRFGAKSFDDPLAELIKLRQVGTVEQYQESFGSLLNRVDLPPLHALCCFLSGLNEEIQNAVRMFKPNTLYDAYCLAKLQEATLASIARKTKPILDRSPFSLWGSGARSGSSNNPQPWNSVNQRGGTYTRGSTVVGTYTRGNTAASSTGSVFFKPTTKDRTISAKEIEERRAKNLCFFCEEKYF